MSLELDIQDENVASISDDMLDVGDVFDFPSSNIERSFKAVRKPVHSYDEDFRRSEMDEEYEEKPDPSTIFLNMNSQVEQKELEEQTLTNSSDPLEVYVIDKNQDKSLIEEKNDDKCEQSDLFNENDFTMGDFLVSSSSNSLIDNEKRSITPIDVLKTSDIPEAKSPPIMESTRVLRDRKKSTPLKEFKTKSINNVGKNTLKRISKSISKSKISKNYKKLSKKLIVPLNSDANDGKKYVLMFDMFKKIEVMNSISSEIRDELIKYAIQAMKNSYCPYSKYPVGAALYTDNGTYITGGNVENASYGATICAERSALVRAIAQGHKKFLAIAVATDSPTPETPCGICRQFMFEFGDYPVYIVTSKTNEIKTTSVKELLPGGFGPHSLDEYNNSNQS